MSSTGMLSNSPKTTSVIDSIFSDDKTKLVNGLWAQKTGVEKEQIRQNAEQALDHRVSLAEAEEEWKIMNEDLPTIQLKKRLYRKIMKT